MKLVKHEKYEDMYYIQWPNGDLSEDFYNKTRASQLLKRDGILDYKRGVTYADPMSRID
jgi:hypothetical protein